MTVDTFQQPGALVAPSSAGTAVDSIVRWASNLSTAAQAIRMIVDTPFMPASFWPSPRVNGQLVGLRDWPTPHLQHPREDDQAYAARREICISSGSIAVVKGDEVGLTPQAALESIYVVRGKPGMYAETMEALARSHGHEIVLVELTDRLCRMKGRHRDSDAWQHFEFTMARAAKAGYVKQNRKYEDDPQTMLHSRCRSITVRGTCPEVLKGLRSVEEIHDEADDDAPRPATRSVQRAAAPRAVAAAPISPATPPQPAQPAPAAAPAPSGPPLPGEDGSVTYEHASGAAVTVLPTAHQQAISEPQWRSINNRLLELGVKGEGQKAARARIIRVVLDAPDLDIPAMTYAQAAFVLDQLAGEAGVRVVADALRPQAQPATETPAGPPLPGEDLPTEEVTEEDYDPTLDKDWGMDGAEAEAEGR